MRGRSSTGAAVNRLAARLLAWLERWALRPGPVQRFMLRSHARAFARLLPALLAAEGAPARVALVGGGLFPRTALVLGELLPACRFTIIDACAAHLEVARHCLQAHAPALCGRVAFVAGSYDPGVHRGFDWVVTPLAYVGARATLYQTPADGAPQPTRLVHDWLWRRRGKGGVVVSPWLLKRLNWVPAARRRAPGSLAPAA